MAWYFQPPTISLSQVPTGYRPARRRLRVVLGDAAQALARVGEPGAAGEVEVEVVVTVRDDVQSGELLVADDRGDRVEVLLAELDIAQSGRIGPLVEVARVPLRAWPRPVTVVGSIRSFVAVSIAPDSFQTVIGAWFRATRLNVTDRASLLSDHLGDTREVRILQLDLARTLEHLVRSAGGAHLHTDVLRQPQRELEILPHEAHGKGDRRLLGPHEGVSLVEDIRRGEGSAGEDVVGGLVDSIRSASTSPSAMPRSGRRLLR